MTKITFTDGQPVLRDGKVGTGQGCCCNNPACCEHYCNKMCCNQIKWVVPGYTDFFTTVDGINCRATLTIPETSSQIRVLVRCSGYVYGSGTFGDPYQDCDTDCEIIEVEYSEDSGETWTTTPSESAAGVTWSIHCPVEGEQPEAEASAQRCAAGICEDEPCDLPCGPGPTEWRLISDYYGDVWFSGDVIPNPLYTAEGEFFCTDPCNPGFPGPPAQPRWLLEHFPFAGSGYNDCPYAPAGWPRTEGDWLYLEVLGCDGANWKRVHDWCECHPGDGEVYFNISDATDPCVLSQSFWSYLGDALGNGTSGGNIYQSPPGCACLRDPATGAQITRTSGASTCCPQCNQYIGATGCSTGLEYLGHGEAVRFTGAVDNEGSNLWNWEDANGDSPAGFWPSDSTDITIAGELRSWRGPTVSGSFANYHPDIASLSFPSVTLEPGGVLAISLTTETLTVDDATIDELMLDGFGVPKACVNGGQYAVGITVTGTATFKNGAENHAVGELSNPYTPYAGITGSCVFESGSKNFGTIAGNCDFSDNASNEGEIIGDCTFADTAENNDTITGNCTFSGDAVNNGTITGDATFSGNATNAGTVTGNCTFSGSATNTGTVDGDATFDGTASMAGDVTGTATFTGSGCYTSGTAGTFDPDPPPAC